MKDSKILNKIGVYCVVFLVYVFLLYLYFNFIFSANKRYYEKENTDNIKVTETVDDSLKNSETTNKNGIDKSKLSTKVNSGSVGVLPNEQIVMDTLNKSTDKDIQYILKNKEKLNSYYMTLLYRNNSSKEFIKDIIDNRIVDYYTGESVDFNREIPFYLQWDRRWGRENYAGGNMALNGCGPTCMAMVVSGLLKDDSITPVTLSKHTEYVEGSGTGWNYFLKVPSLYGLKVKSLPTEKKIYVDELKAKRPIIVNVDKGDFTTIGHYIVLVTVDDDENFIVNDPNNPNNSSEKWTFERLKPQIKNGWSFSKEG